MTADGRVRRVLDDPVAGRGADVAVQHEIGGRRVDLEHRELQRIGLFGQPQHLGALRLEALDPRPAAERQDAVAGAHVGHVRARGDDAPGALGAGPRRQLGAHGVVAADRQEIDGVDREGLDLDDDLVVAGRAGIGRLGAARDLLRRAERGELDGLHVITSTRIGCARAQATAQRRPSLPSISSVVRPPTRASGRPESVTATATTISSGRGASAMRTSMASKWLRT